MLLLLLEVCFREELCDKKVIFSGKKLTEAIVMMERIKTRYMHRSIV